MSEWDLAKSTLRAIVEKVIDASDGRLELYVDGVDGPVRVDREKEAENVDSQ